MFIRLGFVSLVLLLAANVSCSSADNDEETSSAAWTAAREVVVNEFNSFGNTEWIELANEGSQAIDLGNYALADSDKDTGLPKTTKAMRFPAGTTIAPGGYLLVLTGTDEATAGPFEGAECLSDHPAVNCFKAAFSISAANGESLHLLAPDDSIVSSTAYPSFLTPDAAAGQTVCRSPDRTGDFALCSATPGAANSSP